MTQSVATLCRYAGCHILSIDMQDVVMMNVVMLNVVILNVIMLNVIMLSVVGPSVGLCLITLHFLRNLQLSSIS
jgi:hypothetical protein